MKSKSALQGFFKFLIAKNAIIKSPLDTIKFNRGCAYKRKPILFSQSDIHSLISLSQKYSPGLFYPLFLLINETAAKTSDIISLQWKDINFKTNMVQLVHSPELQRREFQLTDELINAFQNLNRIHALVFTNLESQPFNSSSLGKELKRFQKQADLSTKWALHDLRSSYGINFLKNQGPIEALQKIMGHVRPYQTQEIYERYIRYSLSFSGPAAVQETDSFAES